MHCSAVDGFGTSLIPHANQQTSQTTENPSVSVRQFKKHKNLPMTQKTTSTSPPPPRTPPRPTKNFYSVTSNTTFLGLLRLWIRKQLRNVENVSTDTSSHPRKPEYTEHASLSFSLHQLPTPAFQFLNPESVRYSRTRRTPHSHCAAKFLRIRYAKCNKRNQKKMGLEGERIAMKLPCSQSQLA
jgi:hypothetical protein